MSLLANPPLLAAISASALANSSAPAKIGSPSGSTTCRIASRIASDSAEPAWAMASPTMAAAS